jgi:hypothetical protein
VYVQSETIVYTIDSAPRCEFPIFVVYSTTERRQRYGRYGAPKTRRHHQQHRWNTKLHLSITFM